MANKSNLVQVDGVVVECLPSTMFRVQITEDHTVLAVINGRLRQNKIRILTGDKVKVEMSPQDLTRGRIFYRG